MKVLVVATSRKTKGGISSVISSYESSSLWSEFHCHWIETHRDGSFLIKITYLIKALANFAVRLPFYDVIHIHTSQIGSLRRKRLFEIIAKLMGKKVVTHFHAFNTEDTISGVYKKSYKKFFDDADSIIVLSNWWKDAIKKEYGYNDNKVVVLFNPCLNNEEHDYMIDNKTILYAGAVNRRKGYSDLIKAFSKISKKHTDWKLKIAGNGEIEKGINLAESLGLKEKVAFLGWVSGETKDNVFKESAIFCLPSYAEGFPMAVLDAFSFGLPVVTTPVGGIPDIAKDGENMLLFQPGDIETLANKLELLMENQDLRNKLSKESIKFAQNEFNITNITNKLGEIYSDLCSK